LPVIPKGTVSQIIDASLRNAPFWNDVNVLHLTTNMRVLSQSATMSIEERKNAEAFAKWLISVGDGSPEVCETDTSIVLPEG
jgi:hypothetical protein